MNKKHLAMLISIVSASSATPENKIRYSEKEMIEIRDDTSDQKNSSGVFVLHPQFLSMLKDLKQRPKSAPTNTSRRTVNIRISNQFRPTTPKHASSSSSHSSQSLRKERRKRFDFEQWCKERQENSKKN